MSGNEGSRWGRVRRWLGGGSDPLAGVARDACEETAAGDPSALIEGIARLAREAGIAALGAERGAVLEQAAVAAGSAAYLQVGAGTGEAALRLACALEPKAGRLWLMEPAPAKGRWLRQLLAHAGLGDRVELLPCTALDGIPSVHRRFDLIFLRHQPDLLLPDLLHAERHGRLRPGTTVVAALEGVPTKYAAAYRAHVRESGLYESGSREGLEVSRCIAEIEAR